MQTPADHKARAAHKLCEMTKGIDKYGKRVQVKRNNNDKSLLKNRWRSNKNNPLVILCASCGFRIAFPCHSFRFQFTHPLFLWVVCRCRCCFTFFFAFNFFSFLFGRDLFAWRKRALKYAIQYYAKFRTNKARHQHIISAIGEQVFGGLAGWLVGWLVDCAPLSMLWKCVSLCWMKQEKSQQERERRVRDLCCT